VGDVISGVGSRNFGRVHRALGASTNTIVNFMSRVQFVFKTKRKSASSELLNGHLAFVAQKLWPKNQNFGENTIF